MSRKTKSTARSTEAIKLAIRIAEGMAGWATFAQAAHLSKMYSEYLTYLPIYEIGKGRGWNVLPQKKIKRSKSGRGRFKTVDFVFQSDDHKTGIFLEVKYARFNTNHCLQITRDIRKLCELDGSDISSKHPPENVSKFIIVIGQKVNVLDRLRNAKPLKKLSIKNLPYFEDERLLKQVSPAFNRSGERDSDKDIQAWAFPGLGSDNWKYWCILLAAAPWWDSVTKINAEVVMDEEEVNEEEAEHDNLDQVPLASIDE